MSVLETRQKYGLGQQYCKSIGKACAKVQLQVVLKNLLNLMPKLALLAAGGYYAGGQD